MKQNINGYGLPTENMRYLEDVIIMGQAFEEHVKKLKVVFDLET